MSHDPQLLVVVLAAGESKRFGSPKQLINWRGELMLVSVVKKVQTCGIQPYVALGANFEKIYTHNDFVHFQPSVIKIKNWQNGLSETIKQSALFAETLNVPGVVFLLGDQPLIDIHYFETFFKEAQRYPEDIICTAYKDDHQNIGVPAYFPKHTFEKLHLLEGDQGAKKILMEDARRVLICESKLLDIDEPNDLAHAFKLI